MKIDKVTIGDAVLYHGDCLEVMQDMPGQSVNCVVTSPPYWGLRDYGVAGQLGLEKTPEEYTEKLVAVFREVRRVLRDDGTLFLNLGDSYISNPGDRSKVGGFQGKASKERIKAESSMSMNKHLAGLKPKNLVGIPWRVAFALQADGWYLRSDIIWSKPNPMPESVTDRPTKAHEYIFLLTKKPKYFYDADAIREPHKEISLNRVKGNWDGNRGDGSIKTSFSNMDIKRMCNPNGRNRRSVWHIATQSFPEAHFAVYPEKLIEPCVLAGCPKEGVVLDPFNGAGTTGKVAVDNCRKYIGIELNPEYLEISERRLTECQRQGKLFG